MLSSALLHKVDEKKLVHGISRITLLSKRILNEMCDPKSKSICIQTSSLNFREPIRVRSPCFILNTQLKCAVHLDRRKKVSGGTSMLSIYSHDKSKQQQ